MILLLILELLILNSQQYLKTDSVDDTLDIATTEVIDSTILTVLETSLDPSDEDAHMDGSLKLGDKLKSVDDFKSSKIPEKENKELIANSRKLLNQTGMYLKQENMKSRQMI